MIIQHKCFYYCGCNIFFSFIKNQNLHQGCCQYLQLIFKKLKKKLKQIQTNYIDKHHVIQRNIHYLINYFTFRFWPGGLFWLQPYNSLLELYSLESLKQRTITFYLLYSLAESETKIYYITFQNYTQNFKF